MGHKILNMAWCKTLSLTQALWIRRSFGSQTLNAV
jgi:hypothetical protein